MPTFPHLIKWELIKSNGVEFENSPFNCCKVSTTHWHQDGAHQGN